MGFYAFPVCRSYDTIYQPGHANYNGWQAKHNDWAELWPIPDAFFPSLYPLYSRNGSNPQDASFLRHYLINTIHDIRRCIKQYGRNQPIYPFIKLEAVSGSVAVETDVFDDLFRIVYQLADGVVLWSGGGAWSTYSAKPWWANTILPLIQARRFPADIRKKF